MSLQQLAIRGVRNLKKVPGYIIDRIKVTYHHWRADDWQEYYLRTTKREGDFRLLVGPPGSFEEMADWQKMWVIDHGLEPTDTVVDIGCGVLRAGIPLIEYLEPERYYGLDISERAIKVGRKRLKEHNLQHKRPIIIQNDDLRFGELEGVRADYILCQSVWTHLPPELLTEFFDHVGAIMKENTLVLATYFEADEGANQPHSTDASLRKKLDWFYPWDWLTDQAAENGFSINREDREHPNNLEVCLMEPI